MNLLQPIAGINGCLRVLGLSVVVAGGCAQAQEEAPSVDQSGWQRYDWLKPTDDTQSPAATGQGIQGKATQDVSDPFATVATGALFQQEYTTVYTRRLADSLSLSVETSSTLMDEDSTQSPNITGGSPDDLSVGQKVGLDYQPMENLKLEANVHDSSTDASMPGESLLTTGTGFYVQDKLPTNSTLSFGVNADRTGVDPSAFDATTDNSCDTQLEQPLGKLPLTAVIKGHYEQIQTPGQPNGSMPSLEQSLVWKPAEETTVQAGLRQQQYQEYPGIDNQFNEALFADWQQKVVGDVTWHSYAEVMNSKGLIDQAPASPLASGANGTAQATPPGSANTSLTSSLPLEDQTITFSTGPSFQLQKDISASVEYSDRWDKAPAAGSVGQEQRVSVSVKGSF